MPNDGGLSRIQQGARKPSRTRTHFVDPLPLETSSDRGDARKQLPVEEEILAERLARAEAVPRDDLPQRLRLTGQKPSDRSIAVSAAIRIAAAIGRGSARSCPAMLNAVPWSGAVRTIGSPSVTFTASSKCSALIGINA